MQHRMAYQGKYFVRRYGTAAAKATPPVARMLEKGVRTSAGTDATRVASHNPWVSLAWLVTRKTVGHRRLYLQRKLSDLTIVGGRILYGAGELGHLDRNASLLGRLT
ncbi:hypothetical protein LMG28138_03714 [Pararobbsia alpina]|uniref:Amidohydrolase 3 domain-containing protein n=1 Tax=Pararobbsia alpina TaxID=621374 RepID=A0A6S7D2P1_9BURK|nr:hypothetical protein LMG28138_03714 [Pararobbsia alpina]